MSGPFDRHTFVAPATAFSGVQFSVVLGSVRAIAGDGHVGQSWWEADVIMFTGPAYLASRWRELVDGLSRPPAAAWATEIIVTMSSRPESVHRVPVQLRFATEAGGASSAGATLEGCPVTFEIL
jgi:hypothetical protein